MKALQPGQILLDRFTLTAPLGSGLGGETWRAEGPRGPVAIKVVRAGQDVSDGAFQDLIREASVFRTLKNPHIVEYIEFSDRPDEGVAFLVTAFVEGGDLAAHVAARGPFSTREVARLGLQLVEALEALHGANILHRDLKPHNVLVTPREPDLPLLQVTDFGISRRAVHGVVDTVDLKLSPAYAAPEQHRGGILGFPADIFGLGAVLWWLTTGAHPDPNLPFQSLALPAVAPTVQRSDDDQERAGLGRLLGQMMQATPSARPNLADVRQALAAMVHGVAPPIPTEHVTGVEFLATTPQGPSTSRRNPLWMWVIAIAIAIPVIGLAVAVGWIVLEPSGPEPVTEVVDEAPPVPEPLLADPEPVIAEAQPTTVPPPEVAPPAPARLRVNTVPWSQVHVDGQRVGRTRDGGAEFAVDAGMHTISLQSESGLRYEKRMRFRGDQTASLCVNLRTQTELSCR